MAKQSRFQISLVILMLFALVFAVTVVSAQEGDTHDADAEAAVEMVEEAEEPAVEPSTNPLTPLGINSGFLVAQIVNFSIIFLLLLVVLWRPVVNMLDTRAQKIAKGLEDATIAANARRDAEVEAEKIRQAAHTEVQKSIEEGRSRGEELAATIEAEARTEAEKVVADARTRIEAERVTELSGLRDQVGAISIAVAQRLIGEALDEKRQQALIDDFFTKVPAQAKSLSGDVEVVSAMPLSNAEQNKVKKEVGADSVAFSVEPKILGGLIIRAGDQVVDGSVRSNLNELAEQLK
jgi:F-type H+-transporting ATPase subunit b